MDDLATSSHAQLLVGALVVAAGIVLALLLFCSPSSPSPQLLPRRSRRKISGPDILESSSVEGPVQQSLSEREKAKKKKKKAKQARRLGGGGGGGGGEKAAVVSAASSKRGAALLPETPACGVCGSHTHATAVCTKADATDAKWTEVVPTKRSKLPPLPKDSDDEDEGETHTRRHNRKTRKNSALLKKESLKQTYNNMKVKACIVIPRLTDLCVKKIALSRHLFPNRIALPQELVQQVLRANIQGRLNMSLRKSLLAMLQILEKECMDATQCRGPAGCEPSFTDEILRGPQHDLWNRYFYCRHTRAVTLYLLTFDSSAFSVEKEVNILRHTCPHLVERHGIVALARCLWQRGEVQAASQAFEALLSRTSHTLYTVLCAIYLEMALMHRQFGNLEVASACYRKAADSCSNVSMSRHRPAVRVLAGSLYADAGDHAAAEVAFGSALEKHQLMELLLVAEGFFASGRVGELNKLLSDYQIEHPSLKKLIGCRSGQEPAAKDSLFFLQVLANTTLGHLTKAEELFRDWRIHCLSGDPLGNDLFFSRAFQIPFVRLCDSSSTHPALSLIPRLWKFNYVTPNLYLHNACCVPTTLHSLVVLPSQQEIRVAVEQKLSFLEKVTSVVKSTNRADAQKWFNEVTVVDTLALNSQTGHLISVDRRAMRGADTYTNTFGHSVLFTDHDGMDQLCLLLTESGPGRKWSVIRLANNHVEELDLNKMINSKRKTLHPDTRCSVYQVSSKRAARHLVILEVRVVVENVSAEAKRVEDYKTQMEAFLTKAAKHPKGKRGAPAAPAGPTCFHGFQSFSGVSHQCVLVLDPRHPDLLLDAIITANGHTDTLVPLKQLDTASLQPHPYPPYCVFRSFANNADASSYICGSSVRTLADSNVFAMEVDPHSDNAFFFSLHKAGRVEKLDKDLNVIKSVDISALPLRFALSTGLGAQQHACGLLSVQGAQNANGGQALWLLNQQLEILHQSPADVAGCVSLLDAAYGRAVLQHGTAADLEVYSLADNFKLLYRVSPHVIGGAAYTSTHVARLLPFGLVALTSDRLSGLSTLLHYSCVDGTLLGFWPFCAPVDEHLLQQTTLHTEVEEAEQPGGASAVRVYLLDALPSISCFRLLDHPRPPPSRPAKGRAPGKKK